ncbi:MAG: VWA domain-containing protein [Methylibium sp.]|uniref:vWA domain-containing protein n=1 Tax=Methylibium sp. TaxID=2067992 RepID=UPI00182FF0B2|nr:vWA domain-containing protein [Methylibium sp.]MBA3597517.1 VWA domain-containing protein [Methylibium sp.]
MHLDFAQPWLLLLLPLALLPLLRRRSDTLVFSYLAWLPDDRVGRIVGFLWRAFAVTAMAAIVIGLAGPGQSGTQVLRTGRGAEVLILMDRSSSMDAVVHLNAPAVAGGFSVTESKSEIVRKLLADFVAKRPDDRFAFMAFSTSPMPAVPFTQNGKVIQSALAATGIGRGLPDTHMGSALLAAIREFEGRAYSGSRIVLVVSDGGAQLDETTRQRIEAGLSREKIALYWIYIRSGPNSPSLTGNGSGEAQGIYESGEEMALHTFFLSLPTPYRLYQTDDSAAMAAAMAEINRQQNFPLSFYERVPRVDWSAGFYVAALLACAGLLVCRSVQLQNWRGARSET